MTILQSRTIALINAGIDYQQALLNLAKHVNQLCKEVEHHHNYEYTIDQIRLACLDPTTFLKDALNSHYILRAEHDHFARNATRNQINAERIRQKRAESAAALGIPVKSRRPIPPAHAAYQLSPINTPPTPPSPTQTPKTESEWENALQAKRKAIAHQLKYNPTLLDALEADPNFEAPELGERWLINEAIHTMRFDPTKASASPSPFEEEEEDLT